MDKKDIVLKKKNNHLIFAGIIAVLIVIVLFLLVPVRKQDSKEGNSSSLQVSNKNGNSNGRYKIVEDKDGTVTLPVSLFNDNVQYFQYQFDTSSVNFFILKSNDGTIRAAFDACDVCYRAKRGYNQIGDYMQCNNCGQKFPEDQINVVLGGCNPSPLTREIVKDKLVIKVEDIALGKRFF